MASARASTETHAPFSTKLSAAAVWRESSRAIRRTRTLVSTARITLSDVPPDAFFQISDTVRFRLPLPEQCLMDIQGTEAGRTTDNDPVVIFLPFQYRTGSDPELSAHVHRDGNLPLCRELRVRHRHTDILPR